MLVIWGSFLFRLAIVFELTGVSLSIVSPLRYGSGGRAFKA